MSESECQSLQFDQLMAEGLNLDVEAHWGAGFLPGRFQADEPSWSYRAMARPLLAEAESALDMGTGEGRVLASLAPLPSLTVAYEEWWPTVPAARATLTPLDVQLVVALGSNENVPKPESGRRPGLPFQSSVFDVVLNRHEAFNPLEVRRIIKPDGRFLIAQVGSDEADSVRTLLGLSVDERVWAAAVAVAQLESVGWVIEEVHEDRLTMRFFDIAALIGYVRSTPWAFEDLDWGTATPRLQQLHALSRSRAIEAVSHRFVVLARPTVPQA